ncbi:hypothetical protein FKM82_012910 [Ascaphus truei]
MPSNLMKLSSSSMESEFSSRRMSDSGRSGSLDSQGSHSRSRSSNLDDENLKYLTSEEKNALLFFEETLDAFEDELEEPPLFHNTSFGYYSPRSTEESHSETEDIIDLVKLGRSQVEGDMALDSGIRWHTYEGNPTRKETGISEAAIPTSLPLVLPAVTSPKANEKLSPEMPAEHRKCLGGVPTPVVIAQKISEKNADNGSLSPFSPKDGKPVESKKSVATSPISEDYFRFPAPASAKSNRFPTNINITPVGKQYNKTIAKAAVHVHERKAQVLANLNGPTLLADELEGRDHQQQSRYRSSSFRDMATEQTRYEALTKLGLVKETQVQAEIPAFRETSPISNGHHPPKFLPSESPRKLSNGHENISNILKSEPSPFVPLGKTVVFKGEASSSPEKNTPHSSPQSIYEQKQPNVHHEVKKSYSMPRPTGFRPQGITVKFSGRDSTDETKKDALRKLGLLKMSGY